MSTRVTLTTTDRMRFVFAAINLGAATAFLLYTPHPASAIPNGLFGLCWLVAAVRSSLARRAISLRVRA